MSILIVDDSVDARVLLETILRNGGHQALLKADSALAAFEQLGIDRDQGRAAEFDVDLVLMDLDMPGMNGIEACRHLKSVEALHDLPIVMVTADTDLERLQAAFGAGAIDYIAKPVKKVELLSRVGAILKLKEETNQRKLRERDLAELNARLEAANRELERLSFLDGLTGIANRRRFDEFLDQEWRRCARSRVPLAVIMIDIDHFKLYNDTLGHEAGDEVLKRVAITLDDALQRPGDLVARYGGEEFVVVLPGIDAAAALAQGERLRGAVEALSIPHPQSTDDRLTISLGASSTAPPAGSPDALIHAADQALYQAKRAGRNRTRLLVTA